MQWMGRMVAADLALVCSNPQKERGISQLGSAACHCEDLVFGVFKNVFAHAYYIMISENGDLSENGDFCLKMVDNSLYKDTSRHD